MGYVDYREDTEGTVDTWEILDQQRAESPGNFDVPPNAKVLTEVRFEFAPDKGADAIVRAASAFRLNGNGLNLTNKPLRFLGPMGGIANTGASEQSICLVQPAVYYPMIPVIGNGEIEAAFQFFGEDLGDAQGGATLIYDGDVPPGAVPIRGADVREGDLADATEALVRLQGDLDAGTRDFSIPAGVSGISEVRYGVGLDLALDTRIANQFELDGDGFLTDIKPQRWAGSFGQQRLDTEGGETWISPPQSFRPKWAVSKAVNQSIVARAGMVEDDYGAGTAAVGLLFS